MPGSSLSSFSPSSGCLLTADAGAGELACKGAVNALDRPGPAQWVWGLGLSAFIYPGTLVTNTIVSKCPFSLSPTLV